MALIDGGARSGTRGTALCLIMLLTACSGSNAAGDVERGGAPVAGGALVAALDEDDRDTYESGVQQMAEFYDVDAAAREDVVRWVLLEEQSNATDQCMRDLGYAVDPPGGIDAPPEQYDVVLADSFRCFSMFPPHPAYVRLWDDEQVDAQYDWTVEALIPCIEEAGYE